MAAEVVAMRLTNEERAAAPPFWDCPVCGWELDWYEETLTWCDECGAEWQYGEDGLPPATPADSK